MNKRKKRFQNQILQIENDLSTKLLLNDNNNPIAGSIARQLIKEKVVATYKLGLLYTFQHFQIMPFISSVDRVNIDRITSDVYRTLVYNKNMSAALVQLTSRALAKAVISKGREIATDPLTALTTVGQMREWVAILDDRTCPQCEELDGRQ